MKASCHPDRSGGISTAGTEILRLRCASLRMTNPGHLPSPGRFGCPTLAKLGWVFTLILLLLPITRAQDDQSTFTLKVESNIVLTNIVVRDKKTGAIVRGLTRNDFTIQENGKPQRIESFDFQSVDQAAPLDEATVSGSAGRIALGKGIAGNGGIATEAQLRDHRLVVLFFDLTSMQPEDIERSVDAARNYINKQMQPADLVAAISLGDALSLDQDFTQDKQLLLKAVNSYSAGSGSGFQAGATATTNQVEDSTAYTADESEFNDVNTDRELFAISAISKSLAYLNQKKSLLYFSGGIQRDGIENQASLHAAINSAVRANLSIYSVDSRGLEAISPLGDASTGSLRGTAAYTGAATQNNFDANYASQEVMSTLSSDTGGKFYADSNDFAPAFQQMQQDTSAYYVLGFRSTDPAQDGRFRKLTIKVNHPDVKLEYRPGYYAPADYKHSTREGKEQQLQDQLASDLPATDVAVYLSALYFRTSIGKGGTDPDKYTIPISILIPGSQIPFVKGGDRDKATLDILGQIRAVSDATKPGAPSSTQSGAAGSGPGGPPEGRGGPRSLDEGDIRQTIKLAIDSAQQVRQKNIQYSTSFVLPPGRYELKFVVRENETGKMGSFFTELNIPDLNKYPVKLSSIVLASQRVAAPNPKKGDPANPLVLDGQSWIPNVAHVFRPDQHLYLLYNVYDPAKVTRQTRDVSSRPEPTPSSLSSRPERSGVEGSRSTPVTTPGAPSPTQSGAVGTGAGAPAAAGGATGNIRVLTSIEFLSGSTKVFETPQVQATQLTNPATGDLAFQFDLPLTDLKPGLYICQINVVDDAGGTFTFPRTALLIKDAATAPTPNH
jgi:VWFA-related protein